MVTNEHQSWRRRWSTRSVVPVGDAAVHVRLPEVGNPAGPVANRDDLHQRLARPPRRQRAVLVLRFYEDLEDAEIGDVLGMAPGTVRSTVSRALATLRRDPTVRN
jgi:DNA-directed RNA polymerase specialized sigma24 family protein